MSITLYNTQSKQKEAFVPVEPGKVKMYVCGPTVYDYLHIGNFRGAVFYNMVRNWFEASGYDVTYVYNFTDVDDKIIKRATDEGVSPKDIADKYIGEFLKDYAALKVGGHTHNPKVSDHIGDIVEIVTRLIENGKAYEVEGDVYFSVESFENYGCLSRRDLNNAEEGYRIEVDTRKKHPADFALWKSAKSDEDYVWESPWGLGRPGWHIECSAMSRALLGETIDIHGGGLDLVFPHHENELAQSEACSGRQYVKYWMHNNMLEFGKQKMSKSLGNVKTGREFLKEYNGEILKFIMLSAHYRSTIDFSPEQIDRTIRTLAKFYSSLKCADELVNGASQDPSLVSEKFLNLLEDCSAHIESALNDDFNTPEVFAAFHEVTKEFNKVGRKPGKVKAEDRSLAQAYVDWMKAQGKLMALFQEPASEFLKTLDGMLLEKMGLEPEQIDELVKQRELAREQKDWAESDRIRDDLTAKGISIMDSPTGTTWEVTK